ncbi:hypothetical protein C0214_27750 (plasmid) [Methylobacterium sp. DM1]|uniref:hypothetical protein n=1 Tax=Methylobacterium brachiatum TaxID=269660 RepID=UPI000D58DCD0|nr:hypothetical protein [Methylobacterium brachiatum]AWI92055.1 hypothetical protein C0214_27750 [Methylobacterium sp. DM1]AYO86399.1 hypothetical protein EBB05_28840 [Methylobacterium brachiatum]
MQALDHLTANTAFYLVDHPMVSQMAIASTLATGIFVVFAAPAWARLVGSDPSLRRMLHVGGMGVGGCLILTSLFYDSLVRGLDGAITSRPLMYVYYPASIMLSCAAIVFAGFQIFCALTVRPAPLLRAVVPALLGGWLLALSVPVYRFALVLGLDR